MMPVVRAEGPEPQWRWAREADDKPQRLAGQVPCRWSSRSSERSGLALGSTPEPVWRRCYFLARYQATSALACP